MKFDNFFKRVQTSILAQNTEVKPKQSLKKVVTIFKERITNLKTLFTFYCQ
eukprot:UN11764